MQKRPHFTIPFRLIPLIIVCCGLVACQTPHSQYQAQNNLTYTYTGWPKKSVERLLSQYLESKQFLFSESREGGMRFDRKGSNWDSIEYGSFLEPTAWLRLEPNYKKDKESMQITLQIKVSVITHRLSSLEEVRTPKKKHIKEANEVLKYFETMMLQSVSTEESSVKTGER
jgi:hypothetical protein